MPDPGPASTRTAIGTHGMAAVGLDPKTGALHGAADPRVVGAALGY